MEPKMYIKPATSVKRTNVRMSILAGSSSIKMGRERVKEEFTMMSHARIYYGEFD